MCNSSLVYEDVAGCSFWMGAEWMHFSQLKFNLINSKVNLEMEILNGPLSSFFFKRENLLAVQRMKRQCWKAERMWRKTKLEIHYNIYKDSLRAFNVELATARQNFFSNLINSNLNNTHTLFATAEWLTTLQVRLPVKCSPRANVMSLLPSFLRRSIISERRLAHSLSYAEVTQDLTAISKRSDSSN